MKYLKLFKKNRDADPKTWEAIYSREIEKKIRLEYSLNDELAILRQRDDKPEEFKKYNAYVEQCKREVKEEMGISTTN